MKTDNKGQPYVEYEGRRITFVPKGRKEGKDWSDSDVIRIQSHQYDKEGAERPQLCSGAELPIRNHEDLGRIMGLLSKVVAEGYSLASKRFVSPLFFSSRLGKQMLLPKMANPHPPRAKHRFAEHSHSKHPFIKKSPRAFRLSGWPHI